MSAHSRRAESRRLALYEREVDNATRLAPDRSGDLLPRRGESDRLAVSCIRFQGPPQGGGRGGPHRTLRACLRRRPRHGRRGGKAGEGAVSKLAVRSGRDQHPEPDGVRGRRRGTLRAGASLRCTDRVRTEDHRLRRGLLGRPRLRVRGPRRTPLVVLPAAPRPEGIEMSKILTRNEAREALAVALLTPL